MTQTSKEDKSVQTAEGATSWGPKLFFGTLVAILVFFLLARDLCGRRCSASRLVGGI